MSLPETAIFEDIYGNIKGTCSVNVGWWLTSPSLSRVILKDLPTIALTRPDIHVVRLYGFSFFTEMIEDFRKSDSDEVEFVLTHMIEEDTKEYRLQNQN